MEDLELHEMGDQQLLAEYKRTGDGKYFGELFRRYRPHIYGRCLRFFNGNVAWAEETTQDAFTKALEKVRDSTIDHIQGWLYEVAKNLGIDKLRRARESPAATVPENAGPSLAVAGRLWEAPERTTYLREVRRLIHQLNDKQRICLKLVYIDGYSYKEVARVTHYTEKEIKSAVQAGRENLKKSLAGSPPAKRKDV